MPLMAGNSSKDSGLLINNVAYTQGGLSSGTPEMEFCTWVNNLGSPETREKALLELW